jgi:hypothetical protein
VTKENNNEIENIEENKNFTQMLIVLNLATTTKPFSPKQVGVG